MMAGKKTPGVLWDDGLQCYSAVRCHTVNSIHETQGEVPRTIITGDQSEISWLAEFGWHGYVWYLGPEDSSMERKKLGKCCGPFFNEGDAMSAKTPPESRKQVNRISVFPMSAEEARTDEFKKLTEEFEAKLKDKLRDGYNPLENDGEEGTPTWEPYEPIGPQVPEDGDLPEERALPDLLEADEIQHEAYDRHITARVCVSLEGTPWPLELSRERKETVMVNYMEDPMLNPILDTSCPQPRLV